MATRIKGSAGLTPERRFFAAMAIAMVAVIVIGFLPSYYLRGMVPFGPLPPSMTPMVHLHGALFTGWMLLFLAQVLLVTGGRRDIHRKLGMAAVAMLPAMVVVGILAGLYQVARASGPPVVPPLSWLAVPLLAVPAFGGLIAASLIKRRDPASHKRYMILAMVEMTSPGLGRWPWPAFVPAPVVLFGFSDLFVLALVAWDLKQAGKVHRATIIGAAWLFFWQVARLAIWQTEAWLAFARWSVGLVG